MAQNLKINILAQDKTKQAFNGIRGRLSGLKNANQNDQNLLTPLLENKSKRLMKAIDYTNTKYGRYAISIAQAGLSKGWKMRREHSSKIDTASFDSLPKIVV